MNHWNGANYHFSRTLFDASLKDDCRWQGVPFMEPDGGCDPRLSEVVASNGVCWWPENDDLHGYASSGRHARLSFENFALQRRLGSIGGDSWRHAARPEDLRRKNESPEGFKRGSKYTTKEGNESFAAQKMEEKKQTKPEKAISLDDLRQQFPLSLKDAAKTLGVCPTTLKRICRQNGITRWPSRKIKKVNHSLKKLQLVVDSVGGGEGFLKIDSLYSSLSESSSQDLSSAKMEGLQGEDEVKAREYEKRVDEFQHGKQGRNLKVKATLGDLHVRLTLDPEWNFEDLKQEIAKRFSINDINAFSLRYLDCDHGVVLLKCDEDLKACKDFSKANNIHIVKMFLNHNV